MGMRIVRISSDMLQQVLTEGWQAGGEHEVLRCIEGLPPDAEYVEGNELRMVFYHPDWPELSLLDSRATQNIVWQRIKKPSIELSDFTVRIIDDLPDDEIHLVLKGQGTQDLLNKIMTDIYEGGGESEPVGILGGQDLDP